MDTTQQWAYVQNPWGLGEWGTVEEFTVYIDIYAIYALLRGSLPKSCKNFLLSGGAMVSYQGYEIILTNFERPTKENALMRSGVLIQIINLCLFASSAGP